MGGGVPQAAKRSWALALTPGALRADGSAAATRLGLQVVACRAAATMCHGRSSGVINSLITHSYVIQSSTSDMVLCMVLHTHSVAGHPRLSRRLQDQRRT